jgi:hypothetical protein
MHENRETSGAPRPKRERGRSAKAQPPPFLNEWTYSGENCATSASIRPCGYRDPSPETRLITQVNGLRLSYLPVGGELPL